MVMCGTCFIFPNIEYLKVGPNFYIIYFVHIQSIERTFRQVHSADIPYFLSPMMFIMGGSQARGLKPQPAGRLAPNTS